MREAPGCSQKSEREEQQEESGKHCRKAISCGHEASAGRHQRHAFNLKTHQSGTTVKCIHLRQEFYWFRGTTAPAGIVRLSIISLVGKLALGRIWHIMREDDHLQS